jgi:D-psicose/D-tagatose/L-ribulose 3-epimerase
LQVTHGLGGTHLTGALYSALGKYGAPLREEGRANVVRVLAELAAEAKGLGMTLGLKICNRYETNVINTARDALRLADDIGADNVTIHLDTYHMNIEPHEHRGRPRPARLRGRRPAGLRAHRREPPRLPRVGLPRLRGVLPRARRPLLHRAYHLRVVLLGRGLAGAVQRSRRLAHLWDDGDDLAQHARAFIAGQLAASAHR